MKVTSGPNVVPAVLVATRRAWYRALGTSPATGVNTGWDWKSEPICTGGVDWS
ncbi:MAG: hypothetical protein ACXVTC_22425 [Solirubrobacteraceae bacterium]